MPNHDAQVRDLERIVTRQPGSRFFAALAEAYIDRGDPARAITVCERGLSENPDFVRGLLAYARALLTAGRAEAAREAYARARAQSPHDSSVAARWGGLLAGNGQIEEARAALTEALQLNPLDVDARRLLSTLPGGLPAPPKRIPGRTSRFIAVDDAPALPGRSPPRAGTPPPPPPPSMPSAARHGVPPSRLDPTARFVSPPESEADDTAVVFNPPFDDGSALPEPHYQPPPVAAGISDTAPMELVPQPAGPPAAAPPVPPAAAPPRPRGPRRPRPGAVSGQARFSARRERRRMSRRTKLAAIAALFVGAIGIGGGLYLHVRQQRVARLLSEVEAQMATGSPGSYRDAQTQLAGLAAAHPRDGGIAARLAEVAAMRALRFDGGTEARRLAEESAQRAEALAGGDAAATARALLALAQGDSVEAVKVARRAVAAGAPSGMLVLGLCEKTRGRLKAAEEHLALAWSALPRRAIAGCELASVQRRRGRFAEAKATLDDVRAAAPKDLCARLEAVLLLRETGGEGTRVEREALAGSTAPYPALQARHAYIEALVAAAEGDPAARRTHLEVATKAAPWEPEYAWALGRALLLPRGDARRAVVVFTRWLDSSGLAEAPLDLAEARLRLGQAVEAVDVLAKADPAALPETQRGRLETLRLWARHELLQRNAVQIYCSALQRASRVDDELLLACATVALEEDADAVVEHLTRRVQRADLKGTARGLSLLARGDAAAAADQLARAAEGHHDPGGTALLLAQALTRARRDEAALRVLRQAIVADAGSARARLALARGLAAAGARDEALALLQGLVAETPSALRLSCGIAEAYLALGDADRAQAVVAALSARSQAPLVRYAAGLVALARKDQAHAHTELQAAAAADADFAAPRFVLAGIAVAAGRIDDATARYDAAMRTNPEDPFRRLRLALAQADAGLIDEAERSLELARPGLEAAGARSLVADAYLSLARAAAPKGRDPKRLRRAATFYDRATSLPAAPAYVFFEAGRDHEARRDTKTATAEYREAVQRDPQLAEAQLRLGLLLMADKKSRAEAASRLGAYLKLVPDGRHAQRARAALRRLASR